MGPGKALNDDQLTLQYLVLVWFEHEAAPALMGISLNQRFYSIDDLLISNTAAYTVEYVLDMLKTGYFNYF
jgi:hypothetical protein